MPALLAPDPFAGASCQSTLTSASSAASCTTWQFPIRPSSASQCRHGPHRAAVGDDKNAPATVRSTDLANRSEHAVCHLLGRLSVSQPVAALRQAGHTSASASPSHVPKRFSRSAGQVVMTASERGWSSIVAVSSARAQAAKEHSGEWFAGQLAGQRSRLLPASLVERHVGVPLHGSIPVPVGFALTHAAGSS